MTISQLLIDGRGAQRTSQQAFYFECDGRQLTFAQVRKEALACARAMLAEGVGPGDRVLVWAPGLPVWPVVELACGLIGAILVPINTRYSEAELAQIVADTEPRLMFVIATFLQRSYVAVARAVLAAVDASWAQACKVVVLAAPVDDHDMADWRGFLSRAATISDPHLTARMNAVKPEDPFIIQFTSGTTGPLLGAVLSQAQSIRYSYEFGRGMGLDARDTVLSTQPFYHVGGTLATTLMALTIGCEMVVPYYYRPDAVLAMIEEHGCTGRYGTGAMYSMELNDPGFRPQRVATLRKGWAIGSPALLRRIWREMGIEYLVSAYGLTEACGGPAVGRWSDPLEQRLGTSGSAMRGTEIEIRDQDQRVLGVEEVGELCVRGWCVMAGYYNDPDGTREVIDEDGTMHTGDLGYLDSRGGVHYVDRIKEIIRPGGENVSAAEVEQVLETHPEIRRAAIIGVPDERLGEVPLAVVELRAGVELAEKDVVNYCRARLAGFKAPRHVRYTTEWPVSDSGKLLKRDLRTRYRSDFEPGIVGPSG